MHYREVILNPCGGLAGGEYEEGEGVYDVDVRAATDGDAAWATTVEYVASTTKDDPSGKVCGLQAGF